MTNEDNFIYLPVILSGVFLDEGEKNGVEGSREAWLNGELPEILRLRKIPLSLRLAPLRMTV
jgi:hypothetical protein